LLLLLRLRLLLLRLRLRLLRKPMSAGPHRTANHRSAAVTTPRAAAARRLAAVLSFCA
jgi:hypothetical protein